MPPPLLCFLPIASTLLGGLLAIRLRRYLSVLTALGAGLMMGAALLDLLPEAFSLGAQASMKVFPMIGLTIGAFLLFYLLEFLLNQGRIRWAGSSPRRHLIGRAGAGMLIFHSFRDGMAIGAAYTISPPAGYVVAFGIAAHDLGDGINTVLLTTRGERPSKVDWSFLGADALAPLLGILVTAWWTFSPLGSVVLLVLAAGFFLHRATSDLLPELRRKGGPQNHVLASALFGVVLIYGANVMINGHF